MTRFTWILMALACLTFAGCGAADNNATAPGATDAADTEPEKALEDAGLEGISAEDYNQGGPTSDQ